MSIFCIGQSAYDITIPLKEPLIKNRKYRIEKCHECGGGPAFNAACLCAMWGAPVQLVSRIGADHYGEILRKILITQGWEWIISYRTGRSRPLQYHCGRRNRWKPYAV